MSFKNRLEEQVFDIAKRICIDGATIEHNKGLEIERAIFPETASFSGPPKKELDVITARLNKKPEITPSYQLQTIRRQQGRTSSFAGVGCNCSHHEQIRERNKLFGARCFKNWHYARLRSMGDIVQHWSHSTA